MFLVECRNWIGLLKCRNARRKCTYVQKFSTIRFPASRYSVSQPVVLPLSSFHLCHTIDARIINVLQVWLSSEGEDKSIRFAEPDVCGYFIATSSFWLYCILSFADVQNKPETGNHVYHTLFLHFYHILRSRIIRSLCIEVSSRFVARLVNKWRKYVPFVHIGLDNGAEWSILCRVLMIPNSFLMESFTTEEIRCTNNNYLS